MYVHKNFDTVFAYSLLDNLDLSADYVVYPICNSARIIQYPINLKICYNIYSLNE